jgi:hypothetical protein
VGTPKTAIAASPANFSTVPSNAFDSLPHLPEEGRQERAQCLGVVARRELRRSATSAKRAVTSFLSSASIAQV